MGYSNKVSTTIPQNDLKDILQAIESIDQKLPGLVSLTDEEIAALPRMKAHTESFVNECLKYSKKYPNCIPADVNVQEINKDLMLIKTLSQIAQALSKLKKKVEDNILLAGSEAYLPSLAIYNAVKTAEIIKKHRARKSKAVMV